MNKDIFTYIIVFVSLFLIGFYSHQELLLFFEKNLDFSLEKIYLFHAFFSGLICVNLRLLASVDKLSPQLGFIYLGTFILKLVLFGVIFYNPILTKASLSDTEKISLIIPLFIFLLTEVIFVTKILKKNS